MSWTSSVDILTTTNHYSTLSVCVWMLHAFSCWLVFQEPGSSFEQNSLSPLLYTRSSDMKAALEVVPKYTQQLYSH